MREDGGAGAAAERKRMTPREMRKEGESKRWQFFFVLVLSLTTEMLEGYRRGPFFFSLIIIRSRVHSGQHKI